MTLEETRPTVLSVTPSPDAGGDVARERGDPVLLLQLDGRRLRSALGVLKRQPSR